MIRREMRCLIPTFLTHTRGKCILGWVPWHGRLAHALGLIASIGAIERAPQPGHFHTPAPNPNIAQPSNPSPLQTLQILLTLIQTYKRHGLAPYAYLREVLLRIPTGPNPDLRELLPDRQKATHQA